MDMRGGKLVGKCPRCGTYNDMTEVPAWYQQRKVKQIGNQSFNMWEAMCSNCGLYYRTGTNPLPDMRTPTEEWMDELARTRKKREQERFNAIMNHDKATLKKEHARIEFKKTDIVWFAGMVMFEITIALERDGTSHATEWSNRFLNNISNLGYTVWWTGAHWNTEQMKIIIRKEVARND